MVGEKGKPFVLYTVTNSGGLQPKIQLGHHLFLTILGEGETHGLWTYICPLRIAYEETGVLLPSLLVQLKHGELLADAITFSIFQQLTA